MSEEFYNKRVVFRENDQVHAKLRIRLHYDGIKQSDFFRGCIEAYLNQEQEFEDLKNEVGDIKNMLTKIIEKLDG